MTKRHALEKIQHQWQAFQTAMDGLNISQKQLPGASGAEWTVKDMIAHVAFWEQEALRYLPIIIEGKRLPRYTDLYGGIDRFNALKIAEYRGLSLREVVQFADDTHQSLLNYLESVPDNYFLSTQRFYRRLMMDTAKHYPEHTRLILAWKEQHGF